MTQVEKRAEQPPHSPLYQIAEAAAIVYRGIVIDSALKDKKEIGEKGRWASFERITLSRFPELEQYPKIIYELAMNADQEKAKDANAARKALSAFGLVDTQDSRQFLADVSIVRANSKGGDIVEAAKQVSREVGLLRLKKVALVDLVMDVFKGTIKTGNDTERKQIKAA